MGNFKQVELHRRSQILGLNDQKESYSSEFNENQILFGDKIIVELALSGSSEEFNTLRSKFRLSHSLVFFRIFTLMSELIRFKPKTGLED